MDVGDRSEAARQRDLGDALRTIHGESGGLGLDPMSRHADEIRRAGAVAECWQDFIRSLRIRGLADSTVGTVERVATEAISVWGAGEPFRMIGNPAVEDLVLRWRGRDLAGSTINLYLRIIRCCLSNTSVRRAWIICRSGSRIRPPGPIPG